ncbi:hypothetical protein MNBD_GAMMA12-3172 [hydrothermal vent metagenome]|uniref:Uncharacterized protein n=1 Tax=hydrothermal vent metagenome TaxID=652676 RepID=A0A3B0YRA4_9ZZZZ
MLQLSLYTVGLKSLLIIGFKMTSGLKLKLLKIYIYRELYIEDFIEHRKSGTFFYLDSG